MKESITIRNVGPLKDIVIDDITSLTVFIGQSGSGKSMIMKIIVLMRYIFKRICIRSFLKNAGISRSPFKISIETLLRDDLKIHLSKNSAEIIYTVQFENGETYSLVFKENKLTTPGSISNEAIYLSKEAWISETRNIIPAWLTNPANAKGSLGFYFHETLSDFTEATKHIKHLKLNFLEAQLDIEDRNGIPRYMFTIPEKHDPIELRHASSGIQTSAPLALITKYFAEAFSFKEAKRRSILSYLYDSDQLTEFHPSIELSEVPTVANIYVEEPELSLDPSSQVRMLDYLVNIAFNTATNNLTLMMATHSPYLVNALNLIINRPAGQPGLPPERVSVFKVFKGHLINLKSTANNRHTVIETADLTEPMEAILNDYIRLTGE